MTRTATPAALLAAVALVLALAGCGSKDAKAEPEPAPTVTVTSEPTPEATPTPEPTDEPTADATSEEGAATFGPFSAPTDPGVTVVSEGHTSRETFDGVYAYTGAVLYNNGPTTSVDVTLQGISADQAVDSITESFASVPANSFFVVGGALTKMRTVKDTIEVTVAEQDLEMSDTDVTLTIDAAVPPGFEEYLNVPYKATNNGSEDVPAGAMVHVVFLNGDGEIIGGDAGFTNVAMTAGATTRDQLEDVFTPRGVKSVLGYIDLFEIVR